MEIIQFTPIPALVGGALIGLSATFMLVLHGRIAGISGLLSGLINTRLKENFWRALFLLGIVFGALAGKYLGWGPEGITLSSDKILLVIAGFLVGFGSILSGGCTSGHGVCGLSRLSKRSMTATAIFMVTAIFTVFIRNHLL